MIPCPNCKKSTYRDGKGVLRCSICCWYVGMKIAMPKSGGVLVRPGPTVQRPTTPNVDERLLIGHK